MSLADQIRAIRHGVGIVAMDHVAVARVTGPDAFAVVDAASPRPLFVRNAQMLHTVLLDEAGRPFADAYIVAQDGAFLVLAEGPDGSELARWLSAHAPPDATAAVADLGATHTLLSVQGAYAWELIAELVGPEAVGVPYLSTFRLTDPEALCLRAGKTGEYAYHVLIDNARAAAFDARLRALGAEFELTEVGLEALDQCALESGFFCIRTPGVTELTPLELQLGWRIAWDRVAPGLDAARAARSSHARRITWFVLDPHEPTPGIGSDVVVAGQVRGRVLSAWESPLIDRVVGIAVLGLDFAWPHQRLDAPVGSTVAPPLFDNRSLHLDVQRHSFAGRDVDSFPPLWRSS